jgi:peptidoglycan/xylan/chitin deacetylase (PgdA/CDA1 family)
MDSDDPDVSAASWYSEQTATHLFKTTVITVLLSSCQHIPVTFKGGTLAYQFSRREQNLKQTKKTVAPKKKRNTIYLTFDDGPNKGTRKLMHVIEQEQVPVTLFIVGEHVHGSREQTAVFDSILQSKYFELANHSYTHAFHNNFTKFYQVPDSALDDFKRCADSLHLTAGIIRTPGRNIWRLQQIKSTDIKTTIAAADSFYANGYKEMGWDLEWHFDNKLKLTNNSDDMVKQIDSLFAHERTKTPGHLVLLAHDQVYEDAADSSELHQFIIKLKAKNEYDFETVSNYPGIKN